MDIIEQMARLYRRPIFWIAGCKKDLQQLPDEVKDTMGYALYLAQIGRKHPQAKPLKGFHGAGILEIVDDDGCGTYRAVYCVQFKHAVYVLHAFQKKSSSGISTPQTDMEKVKARLKAAQQHAKENHYEK